MENNQKFLAEAKESFDACIKSIREQKEKAENKSDEISERVRKEISEEPLELATGKDFDGIKTYMILLGTGGPASRIIGELNKDEPMTARYQFQNWFMPWTDVDPNEKEKELLVWYAQNFYFEGL